MSQNNMKSPNMDDTAQADQSTGVRGDTAVISPVEATILRDVTVASLAEQTPREEIGYLDRKQKRLVCCILPTLESMTNPALNPVLWRR